METLNSSILVTLLNLAQSDERASVQVLAEQLDQTRPLIARALNELAAEGLISPETIRLTFVGLMQASGLRARMAREASGAAA